LGRIIAVVNQKGGVGKTTTAINLSSCLAELGKKVLLMDIDPQGNASSGLGIDRKLTEARNIYGVFSGNSSIEDITIETSMENLSLAPSNIQLTGAEVELVGMIARETKLRSAVENIVENFDFIIIDCPPSLGLLTVNALTASNSTLIPIQCEYYALEGLSQLVNVIDLIKSSLNTSLSIEGILLTMADTRTNLAKQVIDEVKNYFGSQVFETIIPRSIRLSEAPSFGKPIILYDPASQGAGAYRNLALEVIKDEQTSIRARTGIPDTESGEVC
jgi:chromosome partitioning protein